MKTFLRNLHLAHGDPPPPPYEFDSTTQAQPQNASSNPTVPNHAHEQSPMDNSLTVIELFQSQGCNSCPPTNANLLGLTSPTSRLSNAIFLTYHVTYWDYLGWRDTFGNNAFDSRQRDYVQGLGLRNAFTPQVIVNGRASGVGHSKDALNKVLKEGGEGRAPLVKIDIDRNAGNPDQVALTISLQEPLTAGDQDLDIWLVRYDPSVLNEDIKRGENKGRVLPHRNVVKSLDRVGGGRGGRKLVFVVDKKNDGLDGVVLVQNGVGGPILGAAKI